MPSHATVHFHLIAISLQVDVKLYERKFPKEKVVYGSISFKVLYYMKLHLEKSNYNILTKSFYHYETGAEGLNQYETKH